MDSMQKKAINLARNALFNKCNYPSEQITTDKMFIVWFCKTLQNWKAIVSGTEIKELNINYPNRLVPDRETLRIKRSQE